MAAILAPMLAKHLDLSARLSASCAVESHIFAVSWSMAKLLAKMQITFELLAAWLAAPRFLKMTRLTMQLLFTAGAPLFNQEWAFGAASFLWVAVMLDRRVAAFGTSRAVETAFWRAGSARLRRLQNCSATVTANLCKDGLWAARARPTVAHLLAIVVSTLESTSTCSDANVLSFHNSRFSSCIAVSTASCLPLCGSLFSCTADFRALVSTAVHICLASSCAHWAMCVALMTNSGLARSATSAADINLFRAVTALTGMACRLASMATGELFVAYSITVGDGVLTASSGISRKLLQRCFATWAVSDCIGGKRAMRSSLVLGVANLRALMPTAVVLALTNSLATKRTLKPILLSR